MDFPGDRRYTKEHEWIRLEGDIATVGITDFAQGELGDVVYVELQPAGTEIQRDEAFGTVEAVKTVSELYMPVTGRIAEINEELEGHPEYVNEDPYGKGWMIKLELTDPSEIDALLTADQYREMVD
ncbi:MAG: glycine cleavage system protein GcvH [Rhodothermales bacterium]